MLVIPYAYFGGSIYQIDYLVVGGGSAGATNVVNDYRSYEGGSAGGVVTGSAFIAPNTQLFTRVGAGGVTNNLLSPGNSFLTGSILGVPYNLIAYSGSCPLTDGTKGFSGAPTTHLAGEGYGLYPSTVGGGGGGAGTVGQDGIETYPDRGGSGGSGSLWLDGLWYGGGGGGGIAPFTAGSTPAGGLGGIGGGGRGGNTVAAGQDGTPNTGGGGGSAGNNNASGPGKGGSGIVVIRYKGTQRAQGGTISYSGGYTYHKFLATGSAYFIS